MLSRILPYRLTFRNGLINTILLAPLRRLKLQHILSKHNTESDDNISVIIGIRNRADYRLRNALWSLRHQSYPDELVDIIVVDYGSNLEHRSRTLALCKQYNANCITLDPETGWNKPKCLNYAIKRAKTKFILSSDVDVIFPPNYLGEMIATLKRKPLSAIYSRMHDLPEESTETLRHLEEADKPIPFEEFFNLTTARGPGYENAGINGTYTLYYHYIRGYDEFYSGWGSEDNDLMTRFANLGLNIISLHPRTSYLHQWHEKGEGIDNFHESAKRNRKYYESTTSIIRNIKQWGETD